jgi:DNA-binding Lrp family transcriptional regulator
MFTDGRLRTHVEVDPQRLGLRVDANLRLQVTPRSLDSAGRKLARHPAVHGAFATTGRGNLHVAVWLPTLEDLYQLITDDLADLDITAIDTMLVGRTTKRTP